MTTPHETKRSATPCDHAHLRELVGAVADFDTHCVDVAHQWGTRLASALQGGARLLAAGNGGSAAQAQHLTAELVGRYRDERRAFSAICLNAETSSLTAICNDYSAEELFARQVQAHGRPGDVLVLMSTTGTSPNVLAAARRGRELGLQVWAFTGPRPNPLAEIAHEALSVDAGFTATVQELHLVALHILCAAVDRALGVAPAGEPAGADVAAATSADEPAAARTTVPEDTPEQDPGTLPDPGTQTGAQAGARRGGGDDGPLRARPDGPLVVVGDALLDVDLDGAATRLAPDAPVPVLDDVVEHPRPGGAALAAALAAADGHEVVLVTPLGDDDAGRRLADLLPGVRLLRLPCDGPTPVKRRVRAGGQSLARLDTGGGPAAVRAVPTEVDDVLRSAGAVLVADYGRGTTAVPRLRELLAGLPPGTPLVWDPHPRGAEPVPGVRLVTPNRAEATLFAGRHETDDRRLSGLAAAGRAADVLVRSWRAQAVAVTLGAGGALLSYGQGSPVMAPAPAVTCVDPCGAGDRFAVTAATALGAGRITSEAVQEAVAAAAAFVSAGGAARLSEAGSAPAAPASDNSAEEVAARVSAEGGVVVATGGCFDLLHAGHVATLRAARRLGDCLVVCLNSDASVRRLKGETRPLVPQADRARVLEALEFVDAVLVFDEDTPVEALRRLQPHVWAKGGDYAGQDVPEAAVLAEWGGQAVVLPYLRGRSTTALVRTAVATSAAGGAAEA